MIICDDLVALDNSIDFLKIHEGKRSYYGGAQKWFNDSILKKVGCSIVAAANITAYTAMYNRNTNLYNYEDMSKENFLHHMESMGRFIHPDAIEGLTYVPYFNKGVIEFSKDKGVSMKSHMITTRENFKTIKSFIKEALIKNKPVALLMLKNDVLKEFDWHWMTVTKLFENMDKTYLDFSTWGERRIFTLEDFYNYSSFGALSYFDVLD